VGGLIGACPVPPPGYFFLDHDQRHTLHLGGQYTLPWRAYFSTDVYYALRFLQRQSAANPLAAPHHF
jgi:hypothetical protein